MSVWTYMRSYQISLKNEVVFIGFTAELLLSTVYNIYIWTRWQFSICSVWKSCASQAQGPLLPCPPTVTIISIQYVSWLSDNRKLILDLLCWSKLGVFEFHFSKTPIRNTPLSIICRKCCIFHTRLALFELMQPILSKCCCSIEVPPTTMRRLLLISQMRVMRLWASSVLLCFTNLITNSVQACQVHASL